jgi:DNA invertase Pin-like site-specific DNA recombinase
MDKKINILYARLSREDMDSNGESGSITNQIELLTKYAENNGITPIIPIQDDGWSGTSWSRPGWQELMGYVERGEVSTILVKTLDRVGRDHLRVGLLLEQFQEQGIRLIAVGDNIDTAQGVDDFVPLRTLFAEWFARDTSRKIRAINTSRTHEGRRVTGAIPYGFLRDHDNSKTWKLDGEAAETVRRAYQMTIDGKSITQIARIFNDERILIPTAHWAKIGADNCRKHPNANPYAWTVAMVRNILKREEYMGWCVLNKTVKETYKSKRKPNDPANVLIFKDAHPAIVDEECWNTVQRLRETRRIPTRKGDKEPNPLTGVLYCADCGHKMFYKRGNTGRNAHPHDEYVCSSYRHYTRSCTMHYIRVDAVQTLILQSVKAVAKYALENEAEFIERVARNPQSKRNSRSKTTAEN